MIEKEKIEKKVNAFMSDRYKSPFWHGFAVSWLIWNWKVLVCLFLFDAGDRNGLNHVDFIMENYYSLFNFLFIPVILTAVYILGLPQIDRLINQYRERQSINLSNAKLALHKKAYLTMEQVNQQKLELEIEINKIRNTNFSIEEHNDKLRKETENLKFALEKKEEFYREVNSSRDIKEHFNGRFVMETFDGKEKLSFDVSISENNVYKVDGNNATSGINYIINFFHFHVIDKSIRFVLSKEDKTELKMVELKEGNDGYYLGHEQGLQVKYHRIAKR